MAHYICAYIIRWSSLPPKTHLFKTFKKGKHFAVRKRGKLVFNHQMVTILTIFLKRQNFLLDSIFFDSLKENHFQKRMSKLDLPFRFCMLYSGLHSSLLISSLIKFQAQPQTSSYSCYLYDSPPGRSRSSYHPSLHPQGHWVSSSSYPRGRGYPAIG